METRDRHVRVCCLCWSIWTCRSNLCIVSTSACIILM